MNYTYLVIGISIKEGIPMQKEMSASIRIAVIGCICAVIFGALAYLLALEYGLGWSAATLVALASAILGGGAAWLAYDPRESLRGIRRAFLETAVPEAISCAKAFGEVALDFAKCALALMAFALFLAVTWEIPLSLGVEGAFFSEAAVWDAGFWGTLWIVLSAIAVASTKPIHPRGSGGKPAGLLRDSISVKDKAHRYRAARLANNPPWHHPFATFRAAVRKHQRRRVEMWLRATLFFTLPGAIYVLGWLVVQTLITLPQFGRFMKAFSLRAFVYIHNDERRAAFLSTFYGVLVGVGSGYYFKSLFVCIVLCAIVGALSGPLLYRSARRAASRVENHALA